MPSDLMLLFLPTNRCRGETFKVIKEWKYCGELKVVVKAPDEKTLINLLINAKILRLTVNLIQDSGYTQIEPGFQTAREHEPGQVGLIDEVTSHIEHY